MHLLWQCYDHHLVRCQISMFHSRTISKFDIWPNDDHNIVMKDTMYDWNYYLQRLDLEPGYDITWFIKNWWRRGYSDLFLWWHALITIWSIHWLLHNNILQQNSSLYLDRYQFLVNQIKSVPDYWSNLCKYLSQSHILPLMTMLWPSFGQISNFCVSFMHYM